MARIAGINIPNHQHAEIALTAIYGIGRPRARAICVAAGVTPSLKMKDLTLATNAETYVGSGIPGSSENGLRGAITSIT